MIVNILIGILLLFVLGLFILLGLSRNRYIIVYLLIISLLLGPRIPLGQLTAMQRLDLRVDDLIIVFMFLISASLLLLKKVKTSYPRYMRFLILFILASLFSSGYAAVRYDYSFFNATLFWGRELAYISLCFSIPIFIMKRQHLVTLLKVICIAMSINIVWLFIQIFTGNPRQLFAFTEFSAYGFMSVGETQVTEVAAMYAYSLILFIILFFVYRKSFILGVLIVASMIGLLATLSRGFILSTTVAVGMVFAYLIFSKRILSLNNIILISFALIISIILGIKGFAYFESHELPIQRFSMDSAESALYSTRRDGIWTPLWHSFLENPIFGYGKGNIRELIGTFDEAHNHYLRLLTETGIIGAVLFILFLAYLIKTSFLLLNRHIGKESYVISLNMLMVTAIICIVSITQDGFSASKLAIPFYINVGLINLIYMKHSKEKSARQNDVRQLNVHQIDQEAYYYSSPDT